MPDSGGSDVERSDLFCATQKRFSNLIPTMIPCLFDSFAVSRRQRATRRAAADASACQTLRTYRASHHNVGKFYSIPTFGCRQAAQLSARRVREAKTAAHRGSENVFSWHARQHNMKPNIVKECSSSSVYCRSKTKRRSQSQFGAAGLFL